MNLKNRCFFFNEVNIHFTLAIEKEHQLAQMTSEEEKNRQIELINVFVLY